MGLWPERGGANGRATRRPPFSTGGRLTGAAATGAASVGGAKGDAGGSSGSTRWLGAASLAAVAGSGVGTTGLGGGGDGAAAAAATGDGAGDPSCSDGAMNASPNTAAAMSSWLSLTAGIGAVSPSADPEAGTETGGGAGATTPSSRAIEITLEHTVQRARAPASVTLLGSIL